jgi:SAM-dependent methyltransferase
MAKLDNMSINSPASGEYFKECLRGDRLWGDDWQIDAIVQWYEDEREAYAQLVGPHEAFEYHYHEVNKYFGFNLLKDRIFTHALSFGGAHGYEIIPLKNQIHRITIVESSDSFKKKGSLSIPTDFVSPSPDGKLLFLDNAFDLITCLGVLHHIPNVSRVLKEITRCLSPGGVLVLREPIISMGDWRVSRKGVTVHERGIPINLFRKMISDCQLIVIQESFCLFSVMSALGRIFERPLYNFPLFVKVDAFICRCFRWNTTYHPQRLIDRFRPTCVYYVLSK